MATSGVVRKMIEHTYVPNFLSDIETSELFQACAALSYSITKTVPWNKEVKHSSITFAPDGYKMRRGYNGDFCPLKDAPAAIKNLADKLTAYAGKEIDYLSVVRYRDGNDGMTWHQHSEDRHGQDASVYIVSTGATRDLSIRRIDGSDHKKITALPGSLIVLPSEFNDTHEHAVLKSKAAGVRYAVNCKHLPNKEDNTKAAWLAEGKALGARASERDWEIGSWLVRGEQAFLPSAPTSKKARRVYFAQRMEKWLALVREAAAVTNLSETTLRQYSRVVRKVDRVEGVHFSHHIEVLRCRTIDEKGKPQFNACAAQEILHLAKKTKGWTVADTRAEAIQAFTSTTAGRTCHRKSEEAGPRYSQDGSRGGPVSISRRVGHGIVPYERRGRPREHRANRENVRRRRV